MCMLIVDYVERKCQLCNTLKHEFRLMLERPLYREFRVRCIRKYYWKRTKMHTFIEHFKSENNIVVQNLAIYIQTSMEKGILFCYTWWQIVKRKTTSFKCTVYVYV